MSYSSIIRGVILELGCRDNINVSRQVYILFSAS